MASAVSLEGVPVVSRNAQSGPALQLPWELPVPPGSAPDLPLDYYHPRYTGHVQLYDVINRWPRFTEMALVNAPYPLLGGLAGASGVYLSTVLRQQFLISTGLARITIVFGSCLFPSTLTMLLCRYGPYVNIIDSYLGAPECKICNDMTTFAIASSFGVVYPLIAFPFYCMFAAHYNKLYYIPPMRDRAVFWAFLKPKLAAAMPPAGKILCAFAVLGPLSNWTMRFASDRIVTRAELLPEVLNELKPPAMHERFLASGRKALQSCWDYIASLKS